MHAAEYVHRTKNRDAERAGKMLLEIPAGPETVRAFWLSAGGTILAGQHAMKDGFAANIGGGFHHAFAGAWRRLLHDTRRGNRHPAVAA